MQESREYWKEPCREKEFWTKQEFKQFLVTVENKPETKKAFALSAKGFQWIGDYEITADEVLGGIAPKANKMEQAKRLLRELAETNNAMQSNEIFSLADEQAYQSGHWKMQKKS